MGIYTYRIVIDAGAVNHAGTLPAMTELESLFNLGIIEILKTSVMYADLKQAAPKEKVKSYGTIYGSNWIGHTESFFSGGQRPSRMEMIYKTLWGKLWKKGNESQQKDITNSLRDTIHLDVCWMNEVDFFITYDKGILKKRIDLYKQGFDVRIVTSEECLIELKENLKKDIGTNDPNIISEHIQSSFPILLGSNDCRIASIKDPGTGEILFQTNWIDSQLHIQSTIYDSMGTKLVQLSPNIKPTILHDDASVNSSDPCPTTFNLVGTTPSNTKPEQYLRIADYPVSQFSVSKKGEVYLIGRILPSGQTVFQGKLFNSQGQLIAEIGKKLFTYLGYLNMTNSRGQVLPPGI